MEAEGATSTGLALGQSLIKSEPFTDHVRCTEGTRSGDASGTVHQHIVGFILCQGILDKRVRLDEKVYDILA